jgi:hypothetical protein
LSSLIVTDTGMKPAVELEAGGGEGYWRESYVNVGTFRVEFTLRKPQPPPIQVELSGNSFEPNSISNLQASRIF